MPLERCARPTVAQNRFPSTRYTTTPPRARALPRRRRAGADEPAGPARALVPYAHHVVGHGVHGAALRPARCRPAAAARRRRNAPLAPCGARCARGGRRARQASRVLRDARGEEEVGGVVDPADERAEEERLLALFPLRRFVRGAQVGAAPKLRGQQRAEAAVPRVHPSVHHRPPRARATRALRRGLGQHRGGRGLRRGAREQLSEQPAHKDTHRQVVCKRHRPRGAARCAGRRRPRAYDQVPREFLVLPRPRGSARSEAPNPSEIRRSATISQPLYTLDVSARARQAQRGECSAARWRRAAPCSNQDRRRHAGRRGRPRRDTRARGRRGARRGVRRRPRRRRGRG